MFKRQDRAATVADPGAASPQRDRLHGTPQLEDLEPLIFLSGQQHGIENDKCETLGSDGEFGLAFRHLQSSIYGIAKAFQFRGRMYDFGSGVGLVAALFAAAGFYSYGREIRHEAAQRAAKYLSTDWFKDITRARVHLAHGDCFDLSGDFYSTLDVWYLYPSSGMTPRVVSLYNKHGAPDSALIMRRNGELREGLHTHLHSETIRGANAFDPGFCIAGKNLHVVQRIAECIKDMNGSSC